MSDYLPLNAGSGVIAHAPAFSFHLTTAVFDHFQLLDIFSMLERDRDVTSNYMIMLLRPENNGFRWSTMHNFIEALADAGMVDVDMNEAAFILLSHTVTTLLQHGRPQLAHYLLAVAAPPGLQSVQLWQQQFGGTYPVANLQPASNNVAGLPVQGEGQAANLASLPAFASASALTPASDLAPSFVSSPTASEFLQVTSPEISPRLTTTAPAPSHRPDQKMAPARKSARQALSKKGSTKKTAKKTAAKKKKQNKVAKQTSNRHLDKDDLRQIGPVTAPPGKRWLCPYHIARPGSTKTCKNLFGMRNDMVRHVKGKHLNSQPGWGSDPAHFKDCGPYSISRLRRMGIPIRLRARPNANESAADLVGATTSESGEDSGDDDDDESEDEYISDGDSGPDQGPPKGRKDDGNDGHGHGHGLVQQIAVA